MALSTRNEIDMNEFIEDSSETLSNDGKRTRECPLRAPAQHVKKSIWTVYMMVKLDVFSHSSWNGW